MDLEIKLNSNRKIKQLQEKIKTHEYVFNIFTPNSHRRIFIGSNRKLENLKKQIHNNEFLNNHIIICTLQPQGTVTTALNNK